MSNSDTQIALDYHEHTKHSPVPTSGHYLDWSIQPIPFKIYRDLQPIRLPQEKSESEAPLLSLLSQMEPTIPRPQPNLQDLARLLYCSAGIIKRKAYLGRETFFRAASCTGALYAVELYVVCCDLEGLPAGVYQFSPRDFSLYCLRRGDYRPVLISACAQEASVAGTAMAIISTGTYWRNTWKYQARTYRHFGWDNGTILANLLTMCTALRLAARLVLGFVDAEVNQLLGLDTHREVTLSLVTVGNVEAAPDDSPPVEPLELETVPLSEREVDYPRMHEMHSGSLLTSPSEVADWRGQPPAATSLPATGPIFELDREGLERLSRDPPERVILRRGSSREFEQKPISFKQLSSLLHCCSQGIAADFLQTPGSLLNDWYLIIHAVEGVSPGSYFFNRQRGKIELLEEGEFRNVAGHLGLGQELPRDASFNVFFLANLKSILKRYGNRGYRAVQLEAGILVGKLYLAAYAQRLGATGLTFFDDEVIDFFSPHAQGKSTILLMALGHGRKPRPLRMA